jgi:hypothetical protein
MITYCFAFLYGIAITLSMAGWGGLMLNLLFPGETIDWGQRAAWGLSLSIFVGGLFNLAWIISPPLVITYLFIGLLIWVRFDGSKIRPSKILKLFFRWKVTPGTSKVKTFLAFLLILITILRYAGAVDSNNYNGHDDYHAYLAFPFKMLQMGSLGPDPFSVRRLVSSLGGQYFLQSFALSSLTIRNMSLMDLGVGFLISASLLLGYLLERRISAWVAITIMALFIMIPPPWANTSSLMIALALLFSLFRILDWQCLKENRLIPNTLILSLLIAGISGVKTTYAPFAFAMVLVSYIVRFLAPHSNRSLVIKEAAFVAIGTFLALLPWMISLYQSSGTLFYPILGKGFDGSSYGAYTSPSSFSGLKILLEPGLPLIAFLFVLLPLTIFLRSPSDQEERVTFQPVLLGALISFLVITVGIGGYAVERHTFPVWMVVVFSTLPNLLKGFEKRPNAFWSRNLIVGVILIGLLIVQTVKTSRHWNNAFNLNIGDNTRLLGSLFEKDYSQYANMQKAIPPGASVLSRLSKPFILDFKRNLIYLNGFPGTASPPPGMPVRKGGEALATYLLGQSVRYVAYSYFDEAGFQKVWYGHLLTDKRIHPWLRDEAELTYDFHSNVMELSKTYHKIFDDGEILVLDLAQRKNEDHSTIEPSSASKFSG